MLAPLDYLAQASDVVVIPVRGYDHFDLARGIDSDVF
jgi:hypothetical protein